MGVKSKEWRLISDSDKEYGDDERRNQGARSERMQKAEEYGEWGSKDKEMRSMSVMMQ